MAAPSPRRAPLRIVTAVPLCDGHDSAITTINVELAGGGAEVIYLGYHQPASAIARAAVQEDADAIGLSSYNGGHVVFFREVIAQLRARGGGDIRLFGGGGGTITAADQRRLERSGVQRIFFAGTPLPAIVSAIQDDLRPLRRRNGNFTGDRALARGISITETAGARISRPALRRRRTQHPSTGRTALVVGVTGPGGAGKSTLIDELTARFLNARPGRIAIVANDPSQPKSGGAILGDRVSAIYSRDDRVFFRSLATRGSPSGVSLACARAVDVLRQAGEFELIFVESVGIGQDGDPFGTFSRQGSFVDAVLFVLAPHYGARLQLHKMTLLPAADLVVLNKCDDPQAATAQREISAVLDAKDQRPRLYRTTAAAHDDEGIDGLFAALADHAGWEPAGGERACQLRIEE